MNPLGCGLAALMGASLGLLGGGGSILTVPILVYVLGFEPKQSISMGLAIVGATSLVGALVHWRAGNLQPRAALVFGAVAMAGTWGGTRLAVLVSGSVQLLLFATVMVAAAIRMHHHARREAAGGPSTPTPHQTAFPLLAVSALGVGTLTGLAGVGGGFLIVPALVLRAGLPMKKAVGTSLLVIAFNSFVGFAGYLGHVAVPWRELGAFISLAVVGLLGGTWLSHFVSQAALKRAFSVFLGVMGVFILVQNRGALRAQTPAPVRSEGAQRVGKG